jgi:hypothetical protein
MYKSQNKREERKKKRMRNRSTTKKKRIEIMGTRRWGKMKQKFK